MSLLGRLRDLFFVPKCVWCGRVLSEGACCPDCAADLPRREGAFRGVEFAAAVTAPLRYTGRVRESLLRFKFRGRQVYAGEYGRLIAEAVRRDLAGPFDLVTWAPVSEKRRSKRGYDQAELLARAVAKELDLPLERLLRKTRDTPPNSGLTGQDARRANVSGAYEALSPALMKGKRILLIDDIITTGATLSECVRTLLLAGAEEVLCAAAARAEPGNHKRSAR